MADISRRITRKSLKAKRKAAIKTIKVQAKEKIRQVKLECSIDADRKKTKALEKEQKKELKAQKSNARLAYNARQPRPFSLGEDLFNSISHGIGAGLSVAAIVLLIIRSVFHAPDANVGAWVASYALLGSVLFILYLTSTLSHAISAMGGRKVFERMTFMSIWLLVPALFVPYAMSTLNGTSLTAFVAVLWSIYGLMAILYGVFGNKIRGFSVFAFFVSFFVMTAAFAKCGSLLITGSVLYLIGGAFFMLRNYKWSHSIFHFLGLSGSIFHFFAVYYLLA
ncbi:hemolysin III family protein [Treponema sp.]|uniref:hemolysin III family protein n=1 Tax=Treponema sp. TaxID=166 RepID=UPI00298E7451|nr:hemolysin III family protein [Treponema sp.]MCQ2240982.1 hemolysin III family protein [Treponema sp.]